MGIRKARKRACTIFVQAFVALGLLHAVDALCPELDGTAHAQTTQNAAMVDEEPSAWWLSAQLHGAFLSDIVSGSDTDLALGAAVRVGYRWPELGFGLSLQVDNAWWGEPVIRGLGDDEEDDPEDVFESEIQSSLNFAVGIEMMFLNGHILSSLAFGPTILLRDATVDTPGTVGVWAELRTITLRIDATERLKVIIDPITFTLLLPDLSGIPLLLIHFRTMVGVEWRIGGDS